MRVLYVVSRFPTFSETFIVREMRELIRLGIDVRILSLKQPSEPRVQPEAAALRDRVVYPPSAWRTAARAVSAMLRRPIDAAATLARIAWDFRSRPVKLGKTLVVWGRTQAVMAGIDALHPDHVHAHYATYPSTAALLLSESLDVPFSFTSHAHDVFGQPHLLDDKLRRAAFAVTISEFNKRCFATKSRSDRVRDIHVIHCGVPLADYPFRPDGRTPGSIVGVGWLHEVKGWRYLVEACARLAARGVDFACDIISDGPQRSALEAQIGAAGLSGRVRLLGALDQESLREHLYRASVFVLPCVPTNTREMMDGIPVALMEAMASGTPVASTSISGIPELVEDGVTGLLAPPRDAAALAASIERLLRDPALARGLARNARARIEQRFTVGGEVAKLHDLFRAAEAGRKAA